MNKYLVIYHAPVTSAEQMATAGPEDMEPWMLWAQKCGSGLVDMGAPLGSSITMTPGGNKKGNDLMVGYSIIQADDIAGAQKLLEGHPHLDWDGKCQIEVHEMIAMPG